jgi:hypothetical protein
MGAVVGRLIIVFVARVFGGKLFEMRSAGLREG